MPEKVNDFAFSVNTLAEITPPEIASIHEKLDKIIEFQEKLTPFLPLLAQVAAMVDNPAARFARFRRASKETPSGQD